MRVDAHSIGLGADQLPKLDEIAEILDLTPCVEVSSKENILKTRLLRRITQRLEEKLEYDESFLKEIEVEAYENGAEHGSLKGLDVGQNWDWFFHDGL